MASVKQDLVPRPEEIKDSHLINTTERDKILALRLVKDLPDEQLMP